MKSQQEHWGNQRELGFAKGIGWLLTVHRFAGKLPFYIVLVPVVLVSIIVNRKGRAGSMDYWRRIYPQHRFKRLLGVWLQFWGFSTQMLDRLLIVSNRFDMSSVKIFRAPDFEYVAATRGALVIGSHLGNMEICKAIGDQMGRPVTALVHTQHAEVFNSYLEKLNQHNTVRLLQVTDIGVDTMMLLNERLENGEIIVITGDRIPLDGQRVSSAEFLGEQAQFPQGPYLLASLLKCPVYYMFAYKREGCFEVHVEKLTERLKLDRKQREESLMGACQHFADRLAYHARRAPAQWFNFYRFWDSGKN